mgnify:CR=1 FL=1
MDTIKYRIMRIKDIEKLRELLIKFVPDFNHETDCYEKWMESVQDDVRDLLNGFWKEDKENK